MTLHLRGLQKKTHLPAVLLLAACGEENPRPTGFLPTTTFDALAENIPEWKACENTSGYGCASIRAFGNLFRGGFQFKDIFSKCEKTEEQFSIKITNTADQNFTFFVHILMKEWKPGTHECTTSDASNCHLALSLHTARSETDDTNSCLVSVQSTSPTTGTILCPSLQTIQGGMSIAPGSEFTCGE
jgi:hypothetical protein